MEKWLEGRITAKMNLIKAWEGKHMNFKFPVGAERFAVMDESAIPKSSNKTPMVMPGYQSDPNLSAKINFGANPRLSTYSLNPCK